jgi:hypothetical protein
MADTFQERYRLSVRCLICASPARRGATLCAQCTAALRRARQTPNVTTEDLPPARAARAGIRRSSERHSSYSRAARRASRAAPTPALGGWGTYATIIAFGLAVCLTGYLAIGDNDRLYVGRSAAVASAAPPSPAPAEAREDAGGKTARSPMPSLAVDAVPASSLATDSEVAYDAVTDEHLAIFESLAAPRTVPDRKAAQQGKGSNDRGVTRIAANARKPGGRSPVAAVAAMRAVPVAVAAPPSAEPTAPDRFEQLAFALGRCEHENVIVGLVCKERARIQYCEGEWGVQPQCPVAVVSLNTR